MSTSRSAGLQADPMEAAYRMIGYEVIIPRPRSVWKPSDPLPRLALAILVDAYVVMTWTEPKTDPLKEQERLQVRRETLAWLEEAGERPFSLCWCLRVLESAGVEISRQKVRAGCLLAYSKTMQKTVYRGYGTLTSMQIENKRPKRPGLGKKPGLRSRSSSRRSSTPTSERPRL